MDIPRLLANIKEQIMDTGGVQSTLHNMQLVIGFDFVWGRCPQWILRTQKVNLSSVGIPGLSKVPFL